MFINNGTGRKLLLFLTVIAMAAGCDTTRFTMRQPPGQQVDVFYQATIPNVDVLWVVDNSDSMAEEQQALADSFQDFYKFISNTASFHIGVISTDMHNPDHSGRLLGDPKIITQDTENAEEVFRRNVNVGIGGTGDEQGFNAAATALGPLISTYNAGFLQEDAHLFIIFVSDEDDGSFGEVKYYLRIFEQLKGKGNDGIIKAAAVVGDVPEVPEECRAEKNVRPGERYAELAEESGGIVLSICDDNFAANLDQLGFSAAGLKRHFSLSRRADPGTIAVWVKTMCSAEPMPEHVCNGDPIDDCHGRDDDLYGYTCVLRQSLPHGWSYEEDTNSIRIVGDALPPFGSVVQVGYTPEEDSY